MLTDTCKCTAQEKKRTSPKTQTTFIYRGICTYGVESALLDTCTF